MKAKPKSNKQSSGDLIDRFYKDCTLRELSSIRDYIYRTKEFCAFIESSGRTPLNADRADLKAFLGHLKERGPSTRTSFRH